MKKFLRYIKIPAFFVGLVIVLWAVLRLFTVSDKRIYQMQEAFYQEDTTLDAVYVGSSSTYAFWQAPIGWEKYGITVQPYAIPAMIGQQLKYMIEDTRKTQPDALYIINLNTFHDTIMTMTRLHYLVDFMPLSQTKIAAIRDLGEQAGYTGLDQLEFFFPFIRFHSGWSEMGRNDFVLETEGIKGAVHYASFLKRSSDLTDHYQETAESVELDEEQLSIINDLLQYLRDEDINALFVLVPQTGKDLTVLGQYNALADVTEAAGFPTLNLTRCKDEIGIDISCDYYNDGHTNIHGCVKYMDYLAAYLKEHYGFTDKRGDPAYRSWDEAAERYEEYIAPYCLDFEYEDCQRDLTLPRPTRAGVTVGGDSVMVTWYGQAARDAGADGWVVYRRTGSAGAWNRMSEIAGDAERYIDGNVQPGQNYTYMVVPVRHEGEELLYGNFDYAGIGVTIPG